MVCRGGRNQGQLPGLEQLGSCLGHYRDRTLVEKLSGQLDSGIRSLARQQQSRARKAPRTPGFPSPGTQRWLQAIRHLQSPDKALPFYLGLAGSTVPKGCEVHIHRDAEEPERGIHTPPKMCTLAQVNSPRPLGEVYCETSRGEDGMGRPGQGEEHVQALGG